jgi:polyphosphate kinase
MIKLLYKASQAGVKIDLIVRSMCSLRPGVEGLSENINVISILGRFLEHSRIFYFHNAGDEEIFMGSADLMPRNLNERVEVLFPVRDRKIIRKIRDNIFESYLSDNNKARVMKQKGTYVFRTPPEGEPLLTAQERFLSKE